MPRIETAEKEGKKINKFIALNPYTSWVKHIYSKVQWQRNDAFPRPFHRHTFFNLAHTTQSSLPSGNDAFPRTNSSATSEHSTSRRREETVEVEGKGVELLIPAVSFERPELGPPRHPPVFGAVLVV